jgi:hypothetical protein
VKLIATRFPRTLKTKVVRSAGLLCHAVVKVDDRRTISVPPFVCHPILAGMGRPFGNKCLTAGFYASIRWG